jgi:hypothetical protein
MIDDLILTTGVRSDDIANRPIDNGCHPESETSDWRRSRAYIERFRERISRGRAIRLKCSACMGGDADRMPKGEIARAIDECGSCMCPLWPFRFGTDPRRPEASEAKREAARANAKRFLRRPDGIAVSSAQNERKA